MTRPIHARRLRLDNVTLCAVSSSNVAATVRALEASLAQADFAEALLFTDADLASLSISRPPQVRVVTIEKIGSSQAYSDFILNRLVDHVSANHCLITQWDGHVLDAARWQPQFLEYDYIGASWPQFDDAHAVGNGGFSLRSRRLMEACRLPEFNAHHPEDIAICRTNRAPLEDLGMCFAPVEIANAFSAERAGDPATSFGYHGVFLMPHVLGPERFWDIYRTLDDRTTLRRDFTVLLRAMLHGPKPALRASMFAARQVRDLVSGKS